MSLYGKKNFTPVVRPAGSKMKRSPLSGLVLTGGKSSRMGSDKGLLKHTQKYWSQHTQDLLEACQIPARISINQTQVGMYQNVFKPRILLLDLELPVGGPLRGILSAHRQDPDASWLVLACDMQNMKIQFIKELTEKYNDMTTHDMNTDSILGLDYYAFYNKSSGGVEPLCAIYTASALEQLFTRAMTGSLMAHCPRKIIAQGHSWQRTLTNLEEPAFANWNYKTDIHSVA